jgi:hypothetical protein
VALILADVHKLMDDQLRIFQAFLPDENSVTDGQPRGSRSDQAKGFCQFAKV